MRKRILLLLVATISLAYLGCAGVNNMTKKQDAGGYIQKGQQLEAQGELLAALEQYKIALTISPENSTAMAQKKQLEKKIRKAAQTHYKKGLKLHRRGKYQLARNEFLKTLGYQPDHAGALKMIKPRERIKAKRFITHTVKPNESLSKIAILYYGDYKKFPVIAQFNDITDATKVTPGDIIKVPEIQGVPFMVEDKFVETEKGKEVSPPSGEEIPTDDLLPEVAAETKAPLETAALKTDMEMKDEQAADDDADEAETNVSTYRDLGIDLFNNKQYDEAIVEFKKVLNAHPDDKTTLNYLHLSHLQPAMVLYEKGEYLAAKKEFEEALKYNEDCDKCLTYSKKSELSYKETHYNKGISYFANEQLREAIQEWELVEAIDPNYKTVKENIKKAQRFLKKLEEIQKATK